MGDELVRVARSEGRRMHVHIKFWFGKSQGAMVSG
jgi:hypothetical protein